MGALLRHIQRQRLQRRAQSRQRIHGPERNLGHVRPLRRPRRRRRIPRALSRSPAPPVRASRGARFEPRRRRPDPTRTPNPRRARRLVPSPKTRVRGARPERVPRVEVDRLRVRVRVRRLGERGSLRSTRSSLVPRPRRVDASIVVHSAPRLGPVRAPRDDRRRRANRRPRGVAPSSNATDANDSTNLVATNATNAAASNATNATASPRMRSNTATTPRGRRVPHPPRAPPPPRLSVFPAKSWTSSWTAARLRTSPPNAATWRR